ncbi:MAG: AAA family ATPase [Kiritimatiellae bacterium]|nr:AAA family ATPase [Kiritimatiellia bacterium]
MIRGAKWCGKTTTAKQIAKSIVYMDEPQSRDSNILMAKVNPYIQLKGEAPRLVDEWQFAPTLWDAVRFMVDQKGDNENSQYACHVFCRGCGDGRSCNFRVRH